MTKTVNFNAFGKPFRFAVHNEKEHQQSYWANGSLYESQRNGLIPYLYQHRETYMNKTCIDIGASIGNHTIFFAKVLHCDVHAFEPVAESFNHLKENAALNGINAHLHNYALGRNKTTVSMINMSRGKDNAGMYQVFAGSDVDMRLLDSFNIDADWCKIDVEYYNKPLLIGAAETMINPRMKSVFIECESAPILKETDKIMRSFGFKRVPQVKLNHTPTYLWIK